jgi:hypothetical protein
MVSLGARVALDDSGEYVGRERQRHDWASADMRCLMCARLLGHLLGIDQRRQGTAPAVPNTCSVTFLAYRPVDPGQPVVAFRPGMSFRCVECGGAGALDEIDFFSTYDE